MTKRNAGKTKEEFIKDSDELPQSAVGANNFENLIHQLETSERRYRRLFETAQDGILILDADTAQIVDVNPFLVEMLGYSKEEFLGKKLWEVGAFKNIQEARSAFTKLQSEHYIRYEDMPLEAKDGKLISVEFVSNVYQVDHTNVIQCNIRDISARKNAERTSQRAEESLARGERKYSQLVEKMQEGVWIIDKEALILFANPRMAEILGCTVDEMQGTPLFSFMDERGATIAKRLLERCHQGIIEQHDFEVMRKDGTLINAILETSPMSDESGNYTGVLGCVTDITKRKQAEQALKDNVEVLAALEKTYGIIVESAAEGILIVNTETKRFKYANPAIIRMLGYSQEEFKEIAIGDLSPKDWPNHMISQLEAQVTGETTMLAGIPCLRKDGTVLFADIKTSGALLDGIKCNVGFFTNVSERIRADGERRQNTAKLLKAMDAIIKVLAMTVEVRDPYTSGHQQRVSSLSTSIAHEIGLPAAQIEGIRIAGIVHDIGKMYVPSEILSKPGQLTEIEFSMIKMHSQAGYDILKIVEFPWPIAQTVLQHHERMDGSGYPGHLLGKDIILEARILAVADVVEAMASHRPYRPALGIDKALEEISKKKGILYDAEVVDVCLKLFNEEGFKFEGEIADRNKVSV
jgi:PAS domain S-box-containing protein/putative nucleotidyltransferase with HDIG domain